MGCGDNSNTDEILKYGNNYTTSDSLYVNISDEYHSTYESLTNRVEQVVCNDSIPVYQTNLFDEPKLFQLGNPCWDKHGCILIRKRNVFKIVDGRIELDTIYDRQKMPELLMEHYLNPGGKEMFSESPKKAIVFIEYEQSGFNTIDTILHEVAEAFELIDLNENLNIWFNRRFPPPPPAQRIINE